MLCLTAVTQRKVGLRTAIVEKADELGCFGWTQNTARGTVVGEVRCWKDQAPFMKDFLQTGPTTARVDHVTVQTQQARTRQRAVN
jgi:acylphosphatase